MNRRAPASGLTKASLAELQALYNAREESALADDTDLCVAIAQRALSLGESLVAYDVCKLALQQQPGHERLCQMQGLALARCGALDQAREVMEELYRQGSRDEETLGILARIHKDRGLNAPNRADAAASLERSLELYLAAYRSGAGYWSGINAATLALVVGKKQHSQALAEEVRRQCLAVEKPSLWQRATLGESAILLGDMEGARHWYESALRADPGGGDRASMRRNARLALDAGGQDRSWIDSVLPQPVIAVFSGHMPDAGDRLVPRFPETMSESAAEALRARLQNDDVRIGYASAASGADILFHEAMLQLGRETHVVLPQPPERFARASVSRGESAWFNRFQEVLKRAANVVVHSTSTSGDIAYTYNNWQLLGLARLRSRELDGRVRAYALWDGSTGRPGGTSTAVQDWRGFGEAVEWLQPMAPASWQRAEVAASRKAVSGSVGAQRIVSMLFADAVGFSKLPDECIPHFVEHFLGGVASVLDRQAEPPLTRNTWGDGLYFSFGTLRAAGMFALELCEMVRNTDWTKHALPAQLSLRVALHCGPAHEVTDPVIRQRNFTGTHVSRAARIEPVTPPGSVYASQSFAALCECEGVREFSCEYVGRMPLAKKYGEYPTFSVRRRR